MATSPTITNFTIANQTYWYGRSFNLTPPISNSPGAFSYQSSHPAIASVTGSTVTMLQTGTVTITANQAASASYLAGTATASFIIASPPSPVIITTTNVVDTSGIINVLVQWFPPSDGGYAITSYRIQYSLTNYIEYLTKELILANTPSAVDPVTGRISYLITQLTKGGKYQIRVAQYSRVFKKPRH